MQSFFPVRSLRAALACTLVVVAHCSSSSTESSGPTGKEGGSSGLTVDAGADAAYCYPDNDGVNGGFPLIDIVVDDTGFYGAGPDAGTKDLLTTQNDAQVTLTLTNKGTKPHGFEVGCTHAIAPAGCPTTVCFPASSTIAPIAPGETKTIVFDTPTPDGIIYPFKSSEPSDRTVPGLNEGQWSLI